MVFFGFSTDEYGDLNMMSFFKKIFRNVSNRLFLYGGNRVGVTSSLLFRCKITGKNNSFICKPSFTTRFSIAGNNNFINIKSRELSGVNIQIVGNGNKVLFENCRTLKNLKLIINGDNCSIFIGENVGIGGARLVCEGVGNKIHINKNSMLSDNVELWASDGHGIVDYVSRKVINTAGSIDIKKNVWIGTGVRITKNVVLEEGTIVGMGSIVTKNTEQYSIYCGNPARKIKGPVIWNL
jgi:acetyltransferase-like isoleucine patch superfamily enzyme